MSKYIETPCGARVRVDEEDYGFLSRFKWQMRHSYSSTVVISGYKNGSERIRKTIFMHKVILLAGDDIQVDHINGDKLDNRRENLRIATKAENSWNRRKLNSEKFSSKFKGVAWNKKDNRWRVTIGKDGKYISGGTFKNEIDAAKRYNELSLKHHGEFGHLNIIPEEERLK